MGGEGGREGMEGRRRGEAQKWKDRPRRTPLVPALEASATGRHQQLETYIVKSESGEGPARVLF